MVRRIVIAAAVFAACVGAVVFTGASDSQMGKSFKAEFDNAFGLAEGGDLRIGGVNAGQTTGFSLSDSEPIRAVVEFTISEPGFDSLREDARCQVRQQSLIGEYFVDCQPGNSDRELPEGATIPVEQTASVIPADLVNNILREPYRDRLRLIIAELGTGLAGRPEDLAETLRRAHPGLRETNQVLQILGGQTSVIRNFVADSDEVIDDLAANRADVVRFVEEAGETAEISATRREELAEQFERLPTFLAELDPTMVRLGELADAQIPLLSDLRAASGPLNRFFTELGPFAEASRPAIRSLGETSVIGRRALNESADEIRELREVARGSGRAGEPLRQFLQTLDSRARSIEDDGRAAHTDPPRFDRESIDHPRNRGLRAQGFTGFEAILNYAFWQTLSINPFDGVSHFLRAGLLVDENPEASCTPYGTGEPEREVIARCNSYIGPTQPGVENATGDLGNNRDVGAYDPDPTERGGRGSAAADSASREGQASDGGAGDGRRQAKAASKGEQVIPADARGKVGGLPEDLQGLVDRRREQDRDGGGGSRPGARGGAGSGQSNLGGTPSTQGPGDAESAELLDFLLGP